MLSFTASVSEKIAHLADLANGFYVGFDKMKNSYLRIIARCTVFCIIILLSTDSIFCLSNVDAKGDESDAFAYLNLEVKELPNQLITAKQPGQTATPSPSPMPGNSTIAITIVVTIVPAFIQPGTGATAIPPSPTETNTPSPTETPLPTLTPSPTLIPTPTPGPIERFTSQPSVRIGGSMSLILLIFFGLLTFLGIPVFDKFLQFLRRIFRGKKPNSNSPPHIITGAKLGEEFDPDTWIERSEFFSLKNYIKQIDSGNIALAGPRGIGKSTLMQALLQDPEYLYFVTLGISTPTRYEEKDFVLNLFEGLCWAVLKRIRKEPSLQTLKLPENMYQGPQYTWRERLRPVAFIVSVGVLFVLGQQISLIAQYYDSFPYYTTNVLDWVLFLTSIFLICFVIFILLWVISPIFRRSTVEKIRNIDTTLADMYIEAHRRLERIGFQQTIQSSGGAEFSLASIVKLGSTIGNSLTRQPYTLVGLIADYREFLRTVIDRFGKVIVCIDELDKVMDPQQAREFLRKIKGVFSLRNTYYLVSVSEEALEAFNLRNLLGKDEVDSTFTTVILLKPLSSHDCKNLLEKRISQTGQLEAVFSVLSGGIPRDLIRFARRLYFSGNSDIVEPKQVIYETIRTSVEDVVESIRQDNSVKEKIKQIIIEDLEKILQLKEFTGVEKIIQMNINTLAEKSGDELDWVIGVLLRLGVRLEILAHLANNIIIFEDENMCNKYQRTLSLVPNSPLEAQENFSKLRLSRTSRERPYI